MNNIEDFIISCESLMINEDDIVMEGILNKNPKKKDKLPKWDLFDDVLNPYDLPKLTISKATQIIKMTATKNINHKDLGEYYKQKWGKSNIPEIISRLRLSPIIYSGAGVMIYYSLKNGKIYQELRGDKNIIPEDMVQDVEDLLAQGNY